MQLKPLLTFAIGAWSFIFLIQGQAHAKSSSCDAFAGTGPRGTGGRGVVPLFDASQAQVTGFLFPEETVTPLKESQNGWWHISTRRNQSAWIRSSDGAFDVCATTPVLPFKNDDRVLTCRDESENEVFWIRSAPQRDHKEPSRVLGFADRTGVGSFRLIHSKTDGGAGGKVTTKASGDGRFSAATTNTTKLATIKALIFERQGTGTHNIRVTLEGDSFRRCYELCQWNNPSSVLNMAGRFRIAQCSAASGDPTSVVLERGADGRALSLQIQVGPLGERVHGEILNMTSQSEGYHTILSTELQLATGNQAKVDIEVGRTDAEHRIVVHRNGFNETYENCLLENLFTLQPKT